MSGRKENSYIEYINHYPKSKELWERALKVSRGVHHDSRFNDPFPLYGSRASGTRIYDVEQREYIDYTMGHGSLLLGHSHPLLLKAVQDYLSQGTHYGLEHEINIRWAELIVSLIPAAEWVEFVMSGTEANMLIAQLARAYTGRSKIVKFSGHFFGWSDHLYAGVKPPYDQPVAGRLAPVFDEAISEATVVIKNNDLDALKKEIAKEDVAAVFLEGAGASSGSIATPSYLLQEARKITETNGTLLVIDEVITGFRWAPGGYQEVEGVIPDLCALGKIVSGGLPGAAVCGRKDIMEMLQIKPDNANWNRHKRVIHSGTWNGNPLSAAAGVAMLNELSSGTPQKKATSSASLLAEGMREEMKKRNIRGCVYNVKSTLNVFIGTCRGCTDYVCYDDQKNMDPALIQAMFRHMRLNGVNFQRGVKCFVSAVHTQEDIEMTIEAFGRILDGLLKDKTVNL